MNQYEPETDGGGGWWSTYILLFNSRAGRIYWAKILVKDLVLLSFTPILRQIGHLSVTSTRTCPLSQIIFKSVMRFL